jgi:cell division protease FtsH
MSDRLGPIAFGSSHDEVFIGKDWTQTRNYSEEIASLIDSEVKKVIDECYKECIRLLKENSAKLDLVANALIEFEKLDGEQSKR